MVVAAQVLVVVTVVIQVTKLFNNGLMAVIILWGNRSYSDINLQDLLIHFSFIYRDFTGLYSIIILRLIIILRQQNYLISPLFSCDPSRRSG